MNLGDKGGVTPLQLAAVKRNFEIVELLMTHGARTDLVDKSGNSLMHWIVSVNDVELLEFVLNNRSAIDKRNQRGWTPLMVAAFNGFDLSVSCLLQRGASVNAMNKEGNTALHLVYLKKHTSTAGVLISFGANEEIRNENNQTPLELRELVPNVKCI